MQMRKEATVAREVSAREIPSGTPITLRAGDPVVITQSLGGSYTVMTPVGFLARIDGKDADAIGEPVVTVDAAAQEGKTTEELAWDQLRTCYDPEIPVNIVDLGLIYEVRFESLPEDKQDVTVDMTLTAQGCPAHVQISEQVRSRLEQLPGIRTAHVNIVWSPAWTPERLSMDARKQLGIE
jgi:probable FeS assembly SUF system protein SufT